MYYFGIHYAGIFLGFSLLQSGLSQSIWFSHLLGGIKVKRNQRKPGYRDIEVQAFIFVEKNSKLLKDKGGK